MSEFEPKIEIIKNAEKLVDPEHQKNIEKAIHERAEKARQERSSENLKLLHELAKEQAEAREKIIVEDQAEKEPDALLGMQQSLKSKAYDRTLKDVQRKLPKSARILSKITHNKTVEAISNVSATTIARPSGILGGSTCAFIGSVGLLYYSKHYGFTYNYGLFLLLFFAGFLVGALIELAVWSFYRAKRGKY